MQLRPSTQGERGTYRAIGRIFLPATLGGLVQQSYVLVDSAVVGQYVGIDGLAAVGAAGALYFMLASVHYGLLTGFTIRVARAFGAGAQRTVRLTALGALVFTGLWAVGGAALSIALGPAALRIIGVNGRVLTLGIEYLRVLSAAYPGILFLICVNALFRSIGAPRRSLPFTLGSAVANAVLCYLLVGPVVHIGFLGAPLAAVVASGTASIALVARYRREAAMLVRGVRESSWPEARGEMGTSLRLGAPLGTQYLAISAGSVFLTSVVTHLGSAALAAFSVAGRIEALTTRMPLDISAAVGVLSAQRLGETGRQDADRIVLWDGLRLEACVGLAITAILVVLRDPIAHAFTGGEAADVLARYFLIVYPAFLFYTTMIPFHGYANAWGMTRLAFITTVISFLIVRLTLAKVLAGSLDVERPMWAVDAGWFVGWAYTLAAIWRRRHALKLVGSPAGSARPVGWAPEAP